MERLDANTLSSIVNKMEDASKCALVSTAWHTACLMTVPAYEDITWVQTGDLDCLFRLFGILKRHGRRPTLRGDPEVSLVLLEFMRRCLESDVGPVRIDQLNLTSDAAARMMQNFPSEAFAEVSLRVVSRFDASVLTSALHHLKHLVNLRVEWISLQQGQQLRLSDLPQTLTRLEFTSGADLVLDAAMPRVLELDICAVNKTLAPGMNLSEVFPCVRALQTGIAAQLVAGGVKLWSLPGIGQLSSLRGLSWNCEWGAGESLTLPPALQVLGLQHVSGDMYQSDSICTYIPHHERITSLIVESTDPGFSMPVDVDREVERLRSSSLPMLTRAAFIHPPDAVIQGDFPETGPTTVWDLVCRMVG